MKVQTTEKLENSDAAGSALKQMLDPAETAGMILGLDVEIGDGLDAVRLEMLHICAAAVMGIPWAVERRVCLLTHTPRKV
jgi:hypothetical protein